jgi:hypothetical protein
MEPDLDAAAAWVWSRMDTGLPAHLTYHRRAHTAADVVPAAARLGPVRRPYREARVNDRLFQRATTVYPRTLPAARRESPTGQRLPPLA